MKKIKLLIEETANQCLKMNLCGQGCSEHPINHLVYTRPFHRAFNQAAISLQLIITEKINQQSDHCVMKTVSQQLRSGANEGAGQHGHMGRFFFKSTLKEEPFTDSRNSTR